MSSIHSLKDLIQIFIFRLKLIIMIISSIVAGWAAIDGVAFTTIRGTSLIIDRVTIVNVNTTLVNKCKL